MPDEASINPAFIKAGIDYLKQIGVEPAPILKSAGLEPDEILDMDIRLPLDSAAAFTDLAAAQIGDPFFPLQVGLSIDPKDTGVLGFVLLNAETFGASIACLERYIRLYTDNAEVKLSLSGDLACLDYRIVDPRTRSPRQNGDLGLGFLLNMARVVHGPNWHPAVVRFKKPAPKNISGYARVFQAQLEFGTAQNALLFPRADLETPIPDADSRLHSILTEQLDGCLAALPVQTSLIGDIRAELIHKIQNGEPRISEVAQALGISVRTLQRRLNDSGTSYSSLLDDVRQQMALSLLDETDLPLQEVAFLLGYGDFSSFHHAFRRWFGSSPARFRRRVA